MFKIKYTLYNIILVLLNIVKYKLFKKNIHRINIIAYNIK